MTKYWFIIITSTKLLSLSIMLASHIETIKSYKEGCEGSCTVLGYIQYSHSLKTYIRSVK